MTKQEILALIESAELIFSQQKIQQAIQKQAELISLKLSSIDHNSLPPLVLVVMNGGLIYSGQLLTEISEQLQIDYIHATRYRNSTQGYELEWKVYPQHGLKDRVVIVLDDIFDEGHTLNDIVKYCHAQGAKEVITSVLVTKDHDRRQVDLTVDFSALTVPDQYVFGYGMDYKGQLRNLNGIYALN